MAISKTPSGRWRVRIKAGGVEVASRTFDLKRDAVDWETAQKRALAMGDFVSRSAGRESVESAWERWQAGRMNSKSGTSRDALQPVARAADPRIHAHPVAALVAAG